MSAKTVSPTASLLRSSRFFSMPRPLPLPANDLMGHVQSHRTSDTATLPYPIQQAVTTTPSALSRGDWGLKRPLPLRSTTRSSTPVLRINAIDTREHITDFSSASDLSLNLRRLQELNMPVTTSPRRTKKSGLPQRVGVFEPQLDNTTRTEDVSDQRWKFKGPWVAGMTQGDFEAYVEKELKRRRVEFTKFLRNHARQRLEAERRASQRLEGTFGHDVSQDYLEDSAASAADDIEAAVQDSVEDMVEPEHITEAAVRDSEEGTMGSGDITEVAVQDGEEGVIEEDIQPPMQVITDEQIDSYVQRLRNTFALASELARLIEKFLDLPAGTSTGSAVLDYEQQFYETGPPRTHPSAGLSYLRSAAFLDNHPLFGPQMEHRPLEARVMKATAGPRENVKIGIAGVVSLDPGGGAKKRTTPEAPNNEDKMEVMDRRADNIGIGTPGGNRIWVQPTRLGIDPRGRIKLETNNSSSTTIDVHTGQLLAPTYAQIPKRPAVKGFDEMPRMDRYARERRNASPTTGVAPAASSRPRPTDNTGAIMDFLNSDLNRRDAARKGGLRPGGKR